MASFSDRLATLCGPLDPTRHAAELARLRACRGLPDLDALAREGWLTAPGPKVRLKLVRQGLREVLGNGDDKIDQILTLGKHQDAY